MATIFAALVSAGVLSISGQATELPQAAVETQVPPVELDTILVDGRRLEERVDDFVAEVAAPPVGRGLARWDRAVCIGTANMDRRYAQFMIDRVSTVAISQGLDIGEPGCRPNVMIAAASDADELSTRLVEDEPNGFQPAQSNTDRGDAALAVFKTSDAPVRWWHVSLPVSADTGEPAVRYVGEGPQQIRVRDASRIRSNVRDDLARVYIVLDVTRIGQVAFGALSEYVALIALAQIDPAADTSYYPSILNLFNTSDQLTGLTDWDRDYLTALYTAPRDRARPTQQAREIAREMTGSQTRADEAAVPEP